MYKLQSSATLRLFYSLKTVNREYSIKEANNEYLMEKSGRFPFSTDRMIRFGLQILNLLTNIAFIMIRIFIQSCFNFQELKIICFLTENQNIIKQLVISSILICICVSVCEFGAWIKALKHAWPSAFIDRLCIDCTVICVRVGLCLNYYEMHQSNFYNLVKLDTPRSPQYNLNQLSHLFLTKSNLQKNMIVMLTLFRW